MMAFGLTFILAACSLLYELTIAQTISLFAVNNVVWYSLTVGIFIGSMGLGAFFSQRFFLEATLWGRLVMIEIILSIVGGFSVLAIHSGQAWAAFLLTQGYFEIGTVLFFSVAFLAAALVGILSGAELPLLIELAESASSVKDRYARVIAMDYLGSLAGAILFASMLVPRMDMLEVSWIVALINLAAAALLALQFRRSGGGNYGGFLMVFSAVFMVLLCFSGSVRQYFLKAYYYYAYPREELRREVKHRLTPYQSIDIVRLGAEQNSALPDIIATYSRKYEHNPKLPRGFALYLNKDFQFYADVEEIYHETFAHVPIAAVGKVPRKVLIMGGGDGLLLRELVKYSGIERVVQIEIDPKIVDIFRSDPELAALTNGAYQDPRLELVFDDAYHYIRHSGEVFDAVYLDFPAPVDFSLSKLYSSEFYSMVRQHLAPDGFVAADAPGLMADVHQAETQPRADMRTWHILSNTLTAAGFKEVRPFFSLLEDDNPQALAILQRDKNANSDVDYSLGEANNALKEDLRNIVDNLTSGFIFARPFPSSISAEFNDHGIRMDLLNGKRYALSVATHRAFNYEKDPRAVNSILRPRLPDLSGWWKIRTPY